MNIFEYYPKIEYSLNNFDSVLAVDLNATLKVRDFIKQYKGIYSIPYVVGDGERPDNVAYKVYQDSSLDWLIMLVNNMYSIYDDWPKTSLEFERFIIEKYGSISNASSQIKYYYDANKNIIDLTTYNELLPANRSLESILAWEQRMNDRKRIIRMPSKAVAAKIKSDLVTLNVKPAR